MLSNLLSLTLDMTAHCDDHDLNPEFINAAHLHDRAWDWDPISAYLDEVLSNQTMTESSEWWENIWVSDINWDWELSTTDSELEVTDCPRLTSTDAVMTEVSDSNNSRPETKTVEIAEFKEKEKFVNREGGVETENQVLPRPQCQTCGITCLTSYNLKRHAMNVHREVPESEIAMDTGIVVAKSNKSHKAGNKIWGCRFCPKTYSCKGGLDLHIQSHFQPQESKLNVTPNRVRMYKSELCGMEFTNHGNRLKHVKQYHPEEAHLYKLRRGRKARSGTKTDDAKNDRMGGKPCPLAEPRTGGRGKKPGLVEMPRTGERVKKPRPLAELRTGGRGKKSHLAVAAKPSSRGRGRKPGLAAIPHAYTGDEAQNRKETVKMNYTEKEETATPGQCQRVNTLPEFKYKYRECAQCDCKFKFPLPYFLHMEKTHSSDP